jgi:hypothetical protein
MKEAMNPKGKEVKSPLGYLIQSLAVASEAWAMAGAKLG